jgi:hypothetical protein
VVLLYVGAASEVEKRKDRVDDALHATVLQLKKELLQEVVLH